MEFTRDNYIVIQGSSITDLELSGNELICYSLIQGFSQDKESSFKGSLSYLGSALKVTRAGAKKILDNLIKKGLIEKKVTNINGLKFCEYTIVNGVNSSKHLLTPVDTCKPELTNNDNNIFISDNNNINNNIIEREINKACVGACEYDRAQEQAYADELKNSQAWLESIGMRYHIHSINELHKRIDDFVEENFCRMQVHNDTRHMMQHFADWLRTKQEIERKEYERTNTANKRRADLRVTAKAEDYKTTF